MTTSWAKLIGESPHFNLEARIFNGVCFLTAIGTLFGIIANLLLGAQEVAIIFTSIFLCMGLCYYLARFKGRFSLSILFYMVIINLLNILNFRYNAGINGPGLLIFTLCNVLTLSVIPKKQFLFWIVLNIVIVVSLLFIQFYNPQIIIDNASRMERFIRLGSAYVLLLIYIFLITRYIRQSYNAERALVEKHAAELEVANETKNKLFSILAHDLQSPLASIQNYLEILSEMQLDEEERQSFEKSLLDSTKNTKQMVTNLLSWSKAQMDGVTVNLVSIDLKETLLDILKTYRGIAAEKKVHIVDQLKNAALISADKDMFQLIIRNLIDNAIKFTNPGDEIVISDEVIDNNCRIIIRDNGIGIPTDQQGSIFSLKAASTFGTKNEKGVGLGLVLCKEYIALQDGKINFKSTPGIGTTFYLSFKLLKNNKGEKIAEETAVAGSL
ncbi:MAG: sensor histidine kinase [Sphingobacteriales bacterium]